MFKNSTFFNSHKDHNHKRRHKPFQSEIFAMMAASTFGLAYGGPDRMCIDQGLSQPVATVESGRVEGWYLYDPKTEGFHQSTTDEWRGEEQAAAQALVNVCEHALDDTSTVTLGCDNEEEEEEEQEEEEEEEQEEEQREQEKAIFLRSSFSFIVSNDSSMPTPSSSPFSHVHGKSGSITPSTSTTHGGDGEKLQIEARGQSFSMAHGGAAGISWSISPPYDSEATSRLTVFPPLRETRLSSHRGSVMEAGVILDSRTFGGIGTVQNGRKVDVVEIVA